MYLNVSHNVYFWQHILCCIISQAYLFLGTLQIMPHVLYILLLHSALHNLVYVVIYSHSSITQLHLHVLLCRIMNVVSMLWSILLFLCICIFVKHDICIELQTCISCISRYGKIQVNVACQPLAMSYFTILPAHSLTHSLAHSLTHSYVCKF